MDDITEPQLREIIKKAVQTYGTQKAMADAIGISAAYLNDIIHARRDISDEVARFFGYRLVKVYQKERDP